MPVKRSGAQTHHSTSSSNGEVTYTAEQLQPLLDALLSAKDGDFSTKAPARHVTAPPPLSP